MNKFNKIKKVISCVSVLTICFSLFGIKTYAMDVSIAISPSKIYDERLEQGESKDFKFKVSNKSENSLEGRPMFIDIKGTIENQYSGTIENKNIIFFDKDNVSLDSNSDLNVVMTVNIPKDLLTGSYTIYVNFIQQPLDGISGQRTTAIKVPVYLFVGKEEDYTAKTVDFDNLDNHLNYDETQTTVANEIFSNCIKVLNPLNIIKTINSINTKPLYFFNIDGEQVLDINNDIYTQLKNVATDKKNLSDTNYVYYERGWLNETIKNSKMETSEITVTLNDGTTMTINGTENSLQFIQDQIQKIASTNNNVTLQYLFDYLQVPKNITYEKVNPFFISKISSSSELPITLKGELSTVKNNSESVFKNSISSPTIDPGKTIEFQNLVSDKDLSEGVYSISGTLGTSNITKDINFSFKVENKRDLIAIIVVVFACIYYFLIFVLIICLIKIIKKKLNKNINKKVE